MLEEGRGVERDERAAAAWYRRALDLGSADAEARVGRCYRKGIGGYPLDLNKALELFQLSAAKGSPLGLCCLGTGVLALHRASLHFIFVPVGSMYFEGNAVEKDIHEAIRLYRCSAELGSPYGQHHLGLLLHGGIGTGQNVKEGMNWLELAAQQGLDSAQCALGMILYTVQGCP